MRRPTNSTQRAAWHLHGAHFSTIAMGTNRSGKIAVKRDYIHVSFDCIPERSIKIGFFCRFDSDFNPYTQSDTPYENGVCSVSHAFGMTPDQIASAAVLYIERMPNTLKNPFIRFALEESACSQSVRWALDKLGVDYNPESATSIYKTRTRILTGGQTNE